MDIHSDLSRPIEETTLDYIPGQFYIWEGKQPQALSTSSPQQLRYPFASYCISGSKSYIIDMQPHVLSAGDLVVLRPGQFVERTGEDGDFRAWTFSFTDQFAAELPVPKGNMAHMLRQKANPVRHLDNELINQAGEAFFRSAQWAIRHLSASGATQTILHLLSALNSVARDIDASEADAATPPNSRSERLVMDYLHLAQQRYRHTRHIDPYARQLGVSSKHLSSVVKELTGRSASEWISEYVINEAKTLLRFTTMNVQEISDVLNFPSQSFFGKYFKRHTGLSPKAFREQ